MKEQEKSKTRQAIEGWLTVIVILLIGMAIGVFIMKNEYVEGQIDYASGENIVVEKYTNEDGKTIWQEIK